MEATADSGVSVRKEVAEEGESVSGSCCFGCCSEGANRWSHDGAGMGSKSGGSSRCPESVQEDLIITSIIHSLIS